MAWKLRRHDVGFMVDTLMPHRRDKHHLIDAVEDDERFLEAMLEDDRLFERLMSGDEILVQVSPWLLFDVLLRRARRDLKVERYTTERRRLQTLVLFDTDQVIDLLEQRRLRDYLVTLLASFTRVESATVVVRVRRNVWRRYRISELDVESLMRYSQAVDEAFRFEPYRRIGDACLFFSGLFPRAVETKHRYPVSGTVRPQSRARICGSLEDYEAHGSAFYRLASEHAMAQAQGLDAVLDRLSRRFILAEKALRFVGDRYLGLMKHDLFALG